MGGKAGAVFSDCSDSGISGFILTLFDPKSIPDILGFALG
jgi:hypothetical protein